MRLAFVLFDGITWLDMIGVYAPITKLKAHYLPDLTWDICGFTKQCKDVFGLKATAVLVQNDLSAYEFNKGINAGSFILQEQTLSFN